MKGHSSFKIDWNRVDGTWVEVFRHSNILDSPLDEKYIKHIVDTDGTLQKVMHYDDKGKEVDFPDHKLYLAKGNESNSWFKVKFSEFPEGLNTIERFLATPMLKWIGMPSVILNMDPEYNWMLSGQPCKQIAALTQRRGTPMLDRKVIEENLDVLRKNGYKLKGDDVVFNKHIKKCLKTKV